MSLSPGDTVDGKYRVVQLLGVGSMGSVYEAEHIRLRRRVALKVLHPSVAANRDVVRRFEREAQAAGRIASEHVTQVMDFGKPAKGSPYLVMEHLEGESLGQRLTRAGRMPVHELVAVTRQLLAGLSAAHDAGIIHRDIKPDNVFLVRSPTGDHVKLLDFGVSKFAALDRPGMGMTRVGTMIGTPLFMSPEQARGLGVDPRTDLYSVGVVLYMAITGRTPFAAQSLHDLLFSIVLESPPTIESIAPDVDPAFAAIVHRAMARAPEARFQSARELDAALYAWSQGRADEPERPTVPAPSLRRPPSAPPALCESTPGGLASTKVESIYGPSSWVKAVIAIGTLAMCAGGGASLWLGASSVAADAARQGVALSVAAASAPRAAPTVAPAPTDEALASNVPAASEAEALVEPAIAARARPRKKRWVITGEL